MRMPDEALISSSGPSPERSAATTPPALFARPFGRIGFARADLRPPVLVAIIAIAAVFASLAAAPGAFGWLGGCLALLMLAIAVVDARRFVIPDGLNATSFALALLHAVLQQPDAILHAAGIAVTRGAALALIFLAIRKLYARIRGRDGLGLGDVKLAAVAGAWLDWPMIPIAIQLAAVAALSVYGLRRCATGRAISPTSRVPFGMFFAPAIWLCWLLAAALLEPF